MEIWDAYFKNGRKAGFELTRSDHNQFPPDIYHMVCSVIVRHTDGDFLVMQRDVSKTGWPGMWEATASGSALKGEDKLACIQRELYEETGIRCKKFRQYNREVSDETHAIYFCFSCVVNCSKSSVRLQKGETMAYRWMDLNELLAFMQTDAFVPLLRARLRPYFEGLVSFKAET